MANLIAGLENLADERARQVAIVEGAEAERDRILDAEDGDDSELLEIDRRVALARLALDRLGRLEREAYDQMAPLQLEARRVRWAHARGEYLKLMHSVHAAMEHYEREANRLWSYRGALFNPLGEAGWDDQVPRLPHLAKTVPGGMVVYDSHQYRAELERFSTCMVAGPLPVDNFASRLAQYVEGNLSETDLTVSTQVWGSGAESAPETGREVLIRLSRSLTLPEGEVLKMGDLVKVRACDARTLVTANRATLADTLAEPGSYYTGADYPLRDLSVPSGPVA